MATFSHDNQWPGLISFLRILKFDFSPRGQNNNNFRNQNNRPVNNNNNRFVPQNNNNNNNRQQSQFSNNNNNNRRPTNVINNNNNNNNNNANFRATPADARDKLGNEIYPGCNGTVCLPVAQLCANRKQKREFMSNF